MLEQDTKATQVMEIEALQQWVNEYRSQHMRLPMYFIQTFGCQQNDHDSEIAAGILEEAGLVLAPSILEADIALFNTCSVRANADDRFFGHVGRLKPMKQHGRPIIGVFGCMMEQNVHREHIFSSFTHVDFLLGAGAMELLPQALVSVIEGGQRKKPLDLTRQSADVFGEGMPVTRERGHRALITIMTGCNNFCSYCIVPYTRGREKSRAYDDIMREANKAVEEGASQIMLLGQNVNSYGNDMRRENLPSPSFAELLRDVSEIKGLGIVRYMTSHPKDLSDELIDTIGRYPVIEPHIHLPLQSGSDAILKKMNRRYTSAHYLALVDKLKKARPDMTITTDLIVGFPNETEEDFEATLRLMEQVRFDAAFTFLYSPRIGTPAADQYVEEEQHIVQERFERLVKLQNDISFESNQKLIGRTVDVLIDGPSRRDPDILSGRTRDDRLVNVKRGVMTSSSDATGRFIPVSIEQAGSFSLEGTSL